MKRAEMLERAGNKRKKLLTVFLHCRI